ncbi:hypothetical protein M422DRAFT_220793 [Sphaerobolus stellatus SS14]|nr:hypothetical protein M422DRAFT_220793 [Sphaerobolus stellatus SS14]
MEILNPRSALLSNFEVLTLLRELEAEQLAESRAALAVKKERENDQVDLRNQPNLPPIPEASENLRTVQVEAIAHLSAHFQPTNRQTPQGIRKVTKSLAAYDLTKGEKLQIINLAPTQTVELYVIVEELEDRLNDKIDEILSLVSDSLTAAPVEADGVADADGEWEGTLGDDGGEVIAWEEDEFVDNEGGFEGDLDAEEGDD